MDLMFTIIFLLYIVPLYIANATPILIHGKMPLDLNKKLFGKPIFGKGKTIIGTVSGITAGIIAGALIIILFPYSLLVIPNYLELSFALAFGAIFGDLAKSFFKRRFGIKSGERWELADQLDFIIGGIIISSLLRVPELWLVLVLLIATFFIHKGSNWIAHKLKLKKVPW
ncbi:MAG: CDP-2,3-bis-(O-geranylgeranyl)-sn-glycerol synthase [archaeon]